jgi:hypothetical protein
VLEEGEVWEVVVVQVEPRCDQPVLSDLTLPDLGPTFLPETGRDGAAMAMIYDSLLGEQYSIPVVGVPTFFFFLYVGTT